MPVTIQPESTCDICVYEYGQDDTTLCVLPCGHPICQRCMHSLQGFPRLCPFCRQNLGWQEARPMVCDIAPAAPQASFLFDTAPNDDSASFTTALAAVEDVDEIDYAVPPETEKQRADAKAAKLLRKLTDAFFLEAEAGRDGHPDGLGARRLEKVHRFMDSRQDDASDYGTLQTSARMLQALLDQRTGHVEDWARNEEVWQGLRQTWIDYVKTLGDDLTKLRDENRTLQQQLSERYTLQPIASSSRVMSPPLSSSSSSLRKFHQVPSNNDHNPMPAPPKLVRSLTPRHASMSSVPTSTSRRVQFAQTPQRVPSTPMTDNHATQLAVGGIGRVSLPAPPPRLQAARPPPVSLPPPSSPPRPPPRTHRTLPSELPDVPEPDDHGLPPFEIEIMQNPPPRQRHPDDPGYAWAVRRGDQVLVVPGDRTPPELEEQFPTRSDGYSDTRTRRREKSPMRFRWDAGTNELTQLYPVPAPAPTTSVSYASAPSATSSSYNVNSAYPSAPLPPLVQYGSASTSVLYAPGPSTPALQMQLNYEPTPSIYGPVAQPPPPPRRASLPGPAGHYRRHGREQEQSVYGYPHERRATTGLWGPLDSDSDATRY